MSIWYLTIPIIFVLGIIGIALEDKIKVNKGATALTMCVCMWGLLLIYNDGSHHSLGFEHFLTHHQELKNSSLLDQSQAYVSSDLNLHLGDVSGTLFFILCTMLLVDTIDKYGGFKSVTRYLYTNNKRKLLWRIAFASFFFSALLDNLAAAIVLIAILRSLVPDRTDRLKYACMAIICCNAGGSWSPIGDVTTLLLWTSGKLTPIHQISHVILPALVNMLIPLTIANFWLFKKDATLKVESQQTNDNYEVIIPNHVRHSIFWIGILSLASIPIFQTIFNIPAFLGAILGLIIIWIYTEILFRKRKKLIENASELRISNLMHDTDLSTIFYFLGILMSVAALETSGQLEIMASFISIHLPNTNLLAIIIGVMSSLLDNVALVAGVLGMYPTAVDPTSVFALNGDFWTFLAYCAVTGGSLLIIGSATGVTIMGLENISFGYYLKRFSILALAGYIGGCIIHFLFLL